MMEKREGKGKELGRKEKGEGEGGWERKSEGGRGRGRNRGRRGAKRERVCSSVVTYIVIVPI